MPLDSYMLLQTILRYEAVDPLEIGLQIPDDCPFEITVELAGKGHGTKDRGHRTRVACTNERS